MLTLRCRSCNIRLVNKEMQYDNRINDYNDLCFNCLALSNYFIPLPEELKIRKLMKKEAAKDEEATTKD